MTDRVGLATFCIMVGTRQQTNVGQHIHVAKKCLHVQLNFTRYTICCLIQTTIFLIDVATSCDNLYHPLSTQIWHIDSSGITCHDQIRRNTNWAILKRDHISLDPSAMTPYFPSMQSLLNSEIFLFYFLLTSIR